MSRFLARLVAATLAALAATLLTALPAAADPVEEDCAIDVDLDLVVCVPVGDDLAAAYFDETGLELLPSPDDESSRSSLEAEVAPLASYSLVTFYVNASYSGGSYTIVRGTPCDGSTLSGVANLGTVGMNDVISSFLTYGSCTARLYENVSYAGSTFGYTTSTSSLPTFNDIASPVRAR